MSILTKIFLTITFVSCFPLHHVSEEESSDALAGLSKFLPIAGLVIGGALSAALMVLSLLHAPKLLAGALLTVGWFIFTSGLHLDGLMDTADGIFSHQSQERMLEIMQDSRVGNFGVLAGMCVFILKSACLSVIPVSCLFLAIPLVASWARWAEVYAIGHFVYLRDFGKGKIWHDTIEYPSDLLRAAMAPLGLSLALAAFGYWSMLAVALATMGSGMIAANWLSNKLGGHTGDTYGAVVEIAETAALVVAAVVLR